MAYDLGEVRFDSEMLDASICSRIGNFVHRLSYLLLAYTSLDVAKFVHFLARI